MYRKLGTQIDTSAVKVNIMHDVAMFVSVNVCTMCVCVCVCGCVYENMPYDSV